MSLALNIFALVKVFQEIVMKNCSFTDHFTLDGYTEFHKWFYTYFL